MTTKKALPGERVIKLEVRFFTNALAKGNGQVRPKHAWTAGMVTVAANPSHGIRAAGGSPFQSLLQLPAVIEKVLCSRGIRLHTSGTMKKYMR